MISSTIAVSVIRPTFHPHFVSWFIFGSIIRRATFVSRSAAIRQNFQVTFGSTNWCTFAFVVMSFIRTKRISQNISFGSTEPRESSVKSVYRKNGLMSITFAFRLPCFLAISAIWRSRRLFDCVSIKDFTRMAQNILAQKLDVKRNSFRENYSWDISRGIEVKLRHLRMARVSEPVRVRS